MPKSELISIVIRVLLGLTVIESVANIVFEFVGKTHTTPVWIATMIGGGIAVCIRAYFNEQKKSSK